MKKSTMILLIIAAALVVAGVLLCAVGLMLSAGGFRLEKGFLSFGTRNMVTNEYEFSESISELDVSVATTDVEILPASDGVTKVVCREDAREPHEVFVENGTLKIRLEEKKWYEKINLFSWGERKLTLYLAENEFERYMTEEKSSSEPFVIAAAAIACTALFFLFRCRQPR